MVTPPSATMHCPVTKAAASDARKTAIPGALGILPGRGREFGPDQPRRDRVHADVLRPPFSGEVAHQVVVGGLGNAVGADDRIGDKAADGPYDDEASTPPCRHPVERH